MNAALKHMTPDAFLVWCLDQPDRWELVQGLPIRMMTGATQRHDAIVVNLISELRQRLRGSACRPATADVASRMPGGNVRRPDVTVDCGPAEPDALETTAPTVFFEVLSKSTRTFDIVRKPDEYKTVATLRHIVLIDAREPRVWLWSRADETSPWTDQDVLGLEASVPLAAIGIDLPMVQIYDGITFEAD
jgi:Uma2 family endonuclease